MSYCRFSSDDFQSDVYTYASARGFTTHVASNRLVFAGPLPPPVSMDDFDAWWDRHQRVMQMVDAAKRQKIGGPHDGEDFDDATPGEAADRLEMLRAAGYRVPQYAIDELRAEATDPPDQEQSTHGNP